jgi:hypothetical protein
MASNRDKVAACAKHFVGDGGTHNGINENNTIVDEHGLLDIHMPPTPTPDEEVFSGTKEDVRCRAGGGVEDRVILRAPHRP